MTKKENVTNFRSRIFAGKINVNKIDHKQLKSSVTFVIYLNENVLG